MDGTTKELVSFCGLYCKDCIRYQYPTMKTAQTLLDNLSENTFESYAVIKKNTNKTFKNYDGFIEVLQDIVQLRCDQPCRITGGCSSFAYQILRCCREKGCEGCWACKQLYACDKFKFLKALRGDTPKKSCIIIQ